MPVTAGHDEAPVCHFSQSAVIMPLIRHASNISRGSALFPVLHAVTYHAITACFPAYCSPSRFSIIMFAVVKDVPVRHAVVTDASAFRLARHATR